MSLTSELARADSPIRLYIETEVPILGALSRGHPLREPVARMLGMDDLPKETVCPSPVPPRKRSVIGSALDYRARLHFGRTPASRLVAARGAADLCRGKCEPAHTLERPRSTMERGVVRFFAAYEKMLDRVQPVGRIPSLIEEGELARYCYGLALFEVIFRAGLLPGSPLTGFDPAQGEHGILALADDDAVADLVALGRGFTEDATSFNGMPFIGNPTFTGSLDVGGADADFIIGDALCELKTVSGVTPSNWRSWLTQLVGYALLDYDDRWGIRSLALWLPRQRRVVGYPVSLFVLPLTDLVKGRGVDDEDAVAAGLAKLRGGLRNLIGPVVAATICTEDSEWHEGLRFRQSNRETIVAYAEAVDAALAGNDSPLARFVDEYGYTMPGGAKRIMVDDIAHQQHYLLTNGDDLRRFGERVEPRESPSPRR